MKRSILQFQDFYRSFNAYIINIHNFPCININYIELQIVLPPYEQFRYDQHHHCSSVIILECSGWYLTICCFHFLPHRSLPLPLIFNDFWLFPTDCSSCAQRIFSSFVHWTCLRVFIFHHAKKYKTWSEAQQHKLYSVGSELGREVQWIYIIVPSRRTKPVTYRYL